MMTGATASLLLLLLPALAFGAVVKTYSFNADLPYTALDFFLVPFYVPSLSTAELQVQHLCTSPVDSTNILDWGIQAPNGQVVGWGGGNIEAAIVGLKASSRSYELGPADPKDQSFLVGGNWSVIVGKPRIALPPGSYSINVTLLDAPTLPPQVPQRQPYKPSPPVNVPSNGALAWYAGDFHVHDWQSGDAFANATLDEIATFARDQAGLDFVHFSDHNTVAAGDFIVDAQSRHPDVLLLPGVEFTTYAGHAGAILTTRFVDFRMGWPSSANYPNQTVTIQSAVDAIHSQGGLVAINHKDMFEADPDGDLRNACVGCSWNHGLSFADVDAVEVGIQSWNKVGWVFSPAVLDWWDHAQAAGFYQIAPIGGSDDHHGGQVGSGSASLYSPLGSPTTMVLAANLSHAAIREAISLGRTAVKFYNNSADPAVGLTATYLTQDLTQGERQGRGLRHGNKKERRERHSSIDSSSNSKKSVAALEPSPVLSTPNGTVTQVGGFVVAASPSSGRVLLTATINIPSTASKTAAWYVAFVRNNEQTFTFNVTGSASSASFTATVPIPIQGVDRWRVEAHDASTSNGNTRTGALHSLTNHIFITTADEAKRKGLNARE